MSKLENLVTQVEKEDEMDVGRIMFQLGELANRQTLEEMDDPVELIETMSQALGDPVEEVVSNSRSRVPVYCEEEDITSCHAFWKVSLDSSVGTDKSKYSFCSWVMNYYCIIVSVPSSRTQTSLAARWGMIRNKCNRWADYVEKV